MVRSQGGRDGTGRVRSLRGQREESREKSEERREKRETSTIEMTGLKEAMVRSQKGGMAEKRDGEAQGREDWKRNGWPVAQFEVRSVKCDLRNEKHREKREQRRERREQREESKEGRTFGF